MKMLVGKTRYLPDCTNLPRDLRAIYDMQQKYITEISLEIIYYLIKLPF